MSDEHASDAPTTDEQELNLPVEDHDWLLKMFIRLVNDMDMEIGVTLNVRGLMVSGLLIGGKKYFDGIAQEVLATASPAFGEGFHGFLAKIGEDMYPKKNEENPKQKRGIGFVHLKNATIIGGNGSPIPSNSGKYWRGRLSAVDGFWLGNIAFTR
ncbi:MAG: hypothetical protein KME13_25325 [Myxacorys californica WJT36-NPBG1]|jgi:hypothetical protein|nr:hypothetical protein [Myxacorys californica WJT36-NPBG1]